ncbi:hypothetical protein DEJ48_38885 [Streptomyces venezuelae]|uniref:PLD phosphodiesterase domain-containing protein n=1 Tax=Streptomyces venezuelae TaxID=54571 RepID=A0A5P2C732_STRVZ|nr:phospholipase D-like domain-containing protein [Streptomyces venezuelae]QES38585.1 hypothetical protein DEJ48_38885 [Streptomyces venezuelae]
MAASPDPAKWFLQFAPHGAGRPWADGTEMASRAQPPQGQPTYLPWDSGCRVTTYTSGFDAMNAMRDALVAVIAEAKQQQGPAKGRVYISDWRMNGLRDLSTDNAWGIGPWHQFLAGTQAARDQTVIGLLLQLVQAGVMVRVLLWQPLHVSQYCPADLHAHVLDHHYAARIVADQTKGPTPLPDGEPLGVVALDLRTADRLTASHHQKTMVIRSGATHLAFVGGVDFGFTRRDAVAPGTSEAGDWQAGAGMPDPQRGWPRQAGVGYPKPDEVKPPERAVPSSDLPTAVYSDSDPTAVGHRQRWHDQHLKIEGPAVATLEHQFGERWRDSGRVFDLSQDGNWSGQQVIFSTSHAIQQPDGIRPLPIPRPPPDLQGAASLVQMWRTIPLRRYRVGPPFERGEFTVMAGIAHAVQQATELIWIFDQYLWSEAFARLLNQRLRAVGSLRVIIVLPPHADVLTDTAHEARFRALTLLTASGMQDRVAVFNPWNVVSASGNAPANRGIYVHAKAHTYDGALLVCGSANLNRRSFLCDTELCCAVLDPAVVLAHQKALWQRLFTNEPWPPLTDL